MKRETRADAVERADAASKRSSVYELALHYVLTRPADGRSTTVLPDGDQIQIDVYNVDGAAGGLVVERFTAEGETQHTRAFYWTDYQRFTHAHRVAIGDERWSLIGDAVNRLAGQLRYRGSDRERDQ